MLAFIINYLVAESDLEAIDVPLRLKMHGFYLWNSYAWAGLWEEYKEVRVFPAESLTTTEGEN